MAGGILHPEERKLRQKDRPRHISDRESDRRHRLPHQGEGDHHLKPEEIIRWLADQHDALADRWLLEIRSRSDPIEGELLRLVVEFVDLFVGILPHGLGVLRQDAERVLQQTAELYGNLGAHRGLAAGEPVEEVQLLRGVLLRFLHTSPPGDASEGLGLRELLQLNRLIDLAVAYTSVGHTDTLFFNLFHGTGVAGGPPSEILAEVRDQVSGLRDELSLLAVGGSTDGGGAPPT